MSQRRSDGKCACDCWLLDHDTDALDATPPILNNWYTIFHAYDVRLIWCMVLQSNDEAAAKNLAVRWTIDGNVYYTTFSANNATNYYIYRTPSGSTGGTDGLVNIAAVFNGAYYVDKRGQDFMVEVRITSALGTNQALRVRCVRETLEPT